MEIRGFLHVALMHDWSAVVAEQLYQLANSGLLAKATTVELGVVGPGAHRIRADFHDLTIAYRSETLEEHEFPTLALLQKRCVHGECLLWYQHTKGVSRSGQVRHFADDWRRYMQHFVVAQHERCLIELERADVCGVNWQIEPYPHYSGNFWWARASYIRSLPDIRTLDWKRRHLAEAWIGSGQLVRAANLFASEVNHYESPFPAFRYSGITSPAI